MNSFQHATWRAAVVGRWTGRLLGTVIALFYLALVAGEGPPPLSSATPREAQIFAGMTALFAGLILAWKWEALGGLLTLGGYAALLLLLPEQRPANSIFTVAAGIGVLHVLCWWRLRRGAPPDGVAWAVPKVVLMVTAAGVGIFLLLCANEIFGNPPLMTPALHPTEGMQGTWAAKVRISTARPRPIDVAVEFTIGRDSSVTGKIGDAKVVDGRIVNNRSWFGKWMHWRDEYAVQGSLSKPLTVAEKVADDRFQVVLRQRGKILSGALFVARRPFGLNLEKQ